MHKKNNGHKDFHHKKSITSNRISIIGTLKKFFTSRLNRAKVATDNNLQDVLIETIDEIRTSAPNMSEDEKSIFSNFLKFGSKTVAKIMIPRSDICAVSVTSSQEEVHTAVIANGHTRTLVYQDTMDKILGFIHIKDLFCSLAQNKEFNLKKLIRKHLTVAPSMKLVDLLAEMQKRKTHLTVVLDEYGGTDGIATIEDIIEELVGNIEDEHDAEDEVIETFKMINPKTALCNARVSLDDIESALSIRLKKTDDYSETLGGLVLARAGCVPKTGSTVLIEDNLIAEIVESNSRSIKTIKLIIN